MKRYPALTKIINAVMSIFHGPQVESTLWGMLWISGPLE